MKAFLVEIIKNLKAIMTTFIKEINSILKLNREKN